MLICGDFVEELLLLDCEHGVGVDAEDSRHESQACEDVPLPEVLELGNPLEVLPFQNFPGKFKCKNLNSF